MHGAYPGACDEQKCITKEEETTGISIKGDGIDECGCARTTGPSGEHGIR